MPTAMPIKDEKNGFAWGVKWRYGEGEVGVKSFLVDTDDLELAKDATGLPRPLDQFSAGKPNLLCTSLEPFEHAPGSTSRVVATYAPVLLGAFGGAAPPPSPEAPPGTTYCVIRGVNESVQLYNEVKEDGTGINPTSYAINDGQGMPAYVGRTEIEVMQYLTPPAIPNLDLLTDLNTDKAVNKDSVKLPPLRGTTQRWTIGAMKLLYMGFELNATPTGVITIRHTLWYSYAGHTFMWAPTVAAGGTASQIYLSRRYKSENMSGLWPQN